MACTVLCNMFRLDSHPGWAPFLSAQNTKSNKRTGQCVVQFLPLNVESTFLVGITWIDMV